MKKLVVAAVAMFIATSAFAQFGISVGTSSVASDFEAAYNDIAAGNPNTFHVGISYNIPLFLGFAIEPSIRYKVKGSSISEQFAAKQLDIDFSNGYLKVPVRVSWGPDLGLFRPYVYAEPYVGYALSQDAVASFEKDIVESGLGLDPGVDGAYWKDKSRFEYGLGAGVGITLLKHLAVSAAYYWDMGRLFDDNGGVNISEGGIEETLKYSNCNGVVATLTIYF